MCSALQDNGMGAGALFRPGNGLSLCVPRCGSNAASIVAGDVLSIQRHTVVVRPACSAPPALDSSFPLLQVSGLTTELAAFKSSAERLSTELQSARSEFLARYD